MEKLADKQNQGRSGEVFWCSSVQGGPKVRLLSLMCLESSSCFYDF